ncbi:MAG: PRC-barrel domain-containing protein [Christensenellaceae bacterium]
MSIINYSQLKKKNVVNVCDGKDLGKITDLIIDSDSFRIKSLIVAQKNFFKCDEYEISVCCVDKIGDDTILVNLNSPQEITSCEDDDDN